MQRRIYILNRDGEIVLTSLLPYSLGASNKSEYRKSATLITFVETLSLNSIEIVFSNFYSAANLELGH